MFVLLAHRALEGSYGNPILTPVARGRTSRAAAGHGYNIIELNWLDSRDEFGEPNTDFVFPPFDPGAPAPLGPGHAPRLGFRKKRKKKRGIRSAADHGLAPVAKSL
jgi:hypothetical protein